MAPQCHNPQFLKNPIAWQFKNCTSWLEFNKTSNLSLHFENFTNWKNEGASTYRALLYIVNLAWRDVRGIYTRNPSSLLSLSFLYFLYFFFSSVSRALGLLNEPSMHCSLSPFFFLFLLTFQNPYFTIIFSFLHPNSWSCCSLNEHATLNLVVLKTFHQIHADA